ARVPNERCRDSPRADAGTHADEQLVWAARAEQTPAVVGTGDDPAAGVAEGRELGRLSKAVWTARRLQGDIAALRRVEAAGQVQGQEHVARRAQRRRGHSLSAGRPAEAT